MPLDHSVAFLVAGIIAVLACLIAAVEPSLRD